MTLNATLADTGLIALCADHRLTDADSKALLTDTSAKLVLLRTWNWEALVSYTGVGRWRERDTSQHVVEWFTGISLKSPNEAARLLRARGESWLREISTYWEPRRHTFILAGFNSGVSKIFVISNFETITRIFSQDPAPEVRIDEWTFSGKPKLVVTGAKSAAPRYLRRRIERLLKSAQYDPARIRAELINLNICAANSPQSQDLVSPGCSVASLKSDGKGVVDAEGEVNIRIVMNGMPEPSKAALEKALGFPIGRRKGITFITSGRPEVPHNECSPEIYDPTGTEFSLVELRSPGHLVYISAVNAAGVTTGTISSIANTNDVRPWVSTDMKTLTLGMLSLTPRAINDDGHLIGQALLSSGARHLFFGPLDTPTEFDNGALEESDAVAIAGEYIGGWVSTGPKERGQLAHRPARWWRNRIAVLDRLECDWGEVVDINEDGTALVLGYTASKPHAYLWHPSGETTFVGSEGGVYPLGLRDDLTVLGKANGANDSVTTLIAKPGTSWKQIPLPTTCVPNRMNKVGDVVGVERHKGFFRPWLFSRSGKLIWLPYYLHHSCQPHRISESCIIVGQASADHGVHSLVWKQS